jgi:hypothetical protein
VTFARRLWRGNGAVKRDSDDIHGNSMLRSRHPDEILFVK